MESSNKGDQRHSKPPSAAWGLTLSCHLRLRGIGVLGLYFESSDLGAYARKPGQRLPAVLASLTSVLLQNASDLTQGLEVPHALEVARRQAYLHLCGRTQTGQVLFATPPSVCVPGKASQCPALKSYTRLAQTTRRSVTEWLVNF